MIFVSEYNSYKKCLWNGKHFITNRILRPKLKSKRLKFIFYRSVDVPGPGVPPALISGKLVSELINAIFRTIV
jgi:phytoene desaturase